MEKIQLEIVGISTSSSVSGAYVLLLKEVNGSRELPIIIGPLEAQAIALELEGMKPPRPLTHDLIKTIIEFYGGTITEVCIDGLKDNTFYATLILEGTGSQEEIDVRPSDAIALALRFELPVYVGEDILQEAGLAPEEEKKEETSVVKHYTTKLEQLQSELKEAIEKEDYEKAAKLRDDIRKIQLHS